VNDGWLLDVTQPDLHWDADLLPNVLIYNDKLLLVCDRNGGRITHVFARSRGRARCVSGTPKAYQWLGPLDPAAEVAGQAVDWFSCDGAALQNTVWTPNHAYVACDSNLSRPLLGQKFDHRADGNRYPGDMVPWLFPDNFNAYEGGPSARDAVTFEYQPGTASPPQILTIGPPDREGTFERICREDSEARQGGPGTPVVWHDDRHVGFRKRIELWARSITVTYEGVRAGHVVANEFCVDVRAGVLEAGFHRKDPARDGRAVRLVGLDGATVALQLLHGCEFTPAALLTGPVQDMRLEADRLRLHRVLTDNLELSCPRGGGFAYRIDVPG
jgi:hypothetical protein